jgi:hypothetical protein
MTAQAPRVETAAELRTRVFPPTSFVVPDLIPQGGTLFAGPPKIGKSWAALDIAIAVSTGGTCLGKKCEEGDVLYLALEDTAQRLQERMTKLLGASREWPDRLCFATEWPRASDRGIEHVRAWVTAAARARLVVVDILAAFRPPKSRHETFYDADYAAMRGLQRLASDAGIAVVSVTHLRKSGNESDPFEKITGTLGMSGGSDNVLILDRGSKGATLFVRGRDVPEAELAVEFDRAACRWRVQGAADEVQRTSERRTILDVLRAAGDLLSPSQIASATGMPDNNVRQLLLKMVKSGEVLKCGRGQYQHPGSDMTSNNNSNKITEGETQ